MLMRFRTYVHKIEPNDPISVDWGSDEKKDAEIHVPATFLRI